MAMLDTSKISISLKKLLGKAQTDNAKEPSNEARFSGLTVSASTVFGEATPASPSVTNLYDITGGRVELVRLVLDVDPSSNGHAFVARLPNDYESSSTNPKAGTAPFVNGQVLSSSAGGLQIVPPLYGLSYEAKPYRGGTGAKGSGSLVAPGDVVDWNLDYFNGVLFQENNPDTSPANMTYLECLIWIGDFVTDVLSQQTSSADMIIKASNMDVNTGAPEVVDALDITTYKVAKWYVCATEGTNTYACEIFAGSNGTLVDFTIYGELKVGTLPTGFCDLSVDKSGSSLRLMASTSRPSIAVNVVRIRVLF